MSKDRTEFMLAVIRVARARVQLLTLELDEIGCALKFRMIDPEGAVAWLHEIGAFQFVSMPSPVDEPEEVMA